MISRSARATRRAYPEHAKLAAVVVESQAIGEFIDSSGYVLGTYTPVGRFTPSGEAIPEILGRYFGIDLHKLEAERRAMLAAAEPPATGGSPTPGGQAPGSDSCAIPEGRDGRPQDVVYCADDGDAGPFWLAAEACTLSEAVATVESLVAPLESCAVDAVLGTLENIAEGDRVAITEAGGSEFWQVDL